MTIFPTRATDAIAGRPPRTSGARPASAWAFTGVAVTSFGGPLALAAPYALSRLVTGVTSWPLRRIIIAIGAAVILAALVTLINPERIYDDLLTPRSSLCG